MGFVKKDGKFVDKISKVWLAVWQRRSFYIFKKKIYLLTELLITNDGEEKMGCDWGSLITRWQTSCVLQSTFQIMQAFVWGKALVKGPQHTTCNCSYANTGGVSENANVSYQGAKHESASSSWDNHAGSQLKVGVRQLVNYNDLLGIEPIRWCVRGHLTSLVIGTNFENWAGLDKRY